MTILQLSAVASISQSHVLLGRVVPLPTGVPVVGVAWLSKSRGYWTRFTLEMGIEPNNEGSRFGHCYSSGSVRARLTRGSQRWIWFGHSRLTARSLAYWRNPTFVMKNTKPITQTVPHANDKKCDFHSSKFQYQFTDDS